MSTLVNPVSHLRYLRISLVSIVSAALILLSQMVSMPGAPGDLGAAVAHAQANAEQEGSQGCDYRKEGPFANDICWLNFSNIDFAKARQPQGVDVSIKLDSTLTAYFNLRVVDSFTDSQNGKVWDRKIRDSDVPSWTWATFGKHVYTRPDLRKNLKNSIGTTAFGSGTPVDSRSSVQLTRMRVVGAGGLPVNYGLTVWDAESTNKGEFLEMSSDVDLGDPTYFTPSGAEAACRLGAVKNGNTFTCNGSESNFIGSFGFYTKNPTQFTTVLGGKSQQKIAIGFAKLNATGTVTVDRKGADRIGDTTEFQLDNNWANSTLASTTVTPGQTTGNVSATYLVDRKDPRVEFVGQLTKEKLAYLRYRPEWMCRVDTPDGPGVSKAPKTADTRALSKVIYRQEFFGHIHCDVVYKSVFDFSSTLTIAKKVTGDAAGAALLNGREYRMRYTCTKEGFADAYPDQQGYMRGEVSLRGEQTHRVDNIPVGSNCTVEEVDPFTDPSLAFNKSVSVDDGAQQPNQRVELTTKTGINAVTMTNEYNRILGKINVTKDVTGPAAAPFANTPVTMKYQCTGDSEKTLTAHPGSAVTSAVEVPVETDCFLWEEITLTPEQQEKLQMTTSYAVNDGQLAVLQGSRMPFRIPAARRAGDIATLPIRVVNNFDYRRAPLTITSTLTGAAAAKVANSGATFPVTWECTWDNGAHSERGEVPFSPGSEQAVAQVPVGSMCRVFEKEPTGGQPVLSQVELTKSTVKYADGEKTNADATTAAHFVAIKPVFTNGGNHVTIENNYIDKLGVVHLQKKVDSTVSDAHSAEYTVAYNCGVRTVATAHGTTDVPLTGRIRLTEGHAAAPIQADNADANDQAGGGMGVPFGNTCVFTEDLDNLPANTTGTNRFTSEVGSPVTENGTLVINDQDTTVQVTNTVALIPGGLSVQARTESAVGLETDHTDLHVVCKAPEDAVGARDIDDDLALSTNDGHDTHEYERHDVPSGTLCQVTVKSEPNTRSNPLTGGSFPVKKTVTVQVDGKNIGTSTSFEDTAFPHFRVDDQTKVVVTSVYDYAYGDVAIDKNVAFDSNTGNMVPDHDGKQAHDYTFNVVCTTPLGASSTHTVTAHHGQRGVVTRVPVGSVCSAAEKPLTPTERGDGVTLAVTSHRGDGAGVAAAPATHKLTGEANLPFLVTTEDGVQTMHFVNTFARELADVKVLFAMENPGNDAAAALTSGDNPNDYTVTLTCTDPLAPDAAPMTVRATPQRHDLVTNGSAEITLPNVPIGTNCVASAGIQNVTFNYTAQLPSGQVTSRPELTTRTTWKTDDTLPTYILENDSKSADTNHSTPLRVRAGQPANGNNTVNVTVRHAYTTAAVEMKKVVKIPADDAQLLRDARPTYHFTYVCKGPDLSTTNPSGNVSSLFTSATFEGDDRLGTGFISSPGSHPTGREEKTFEYRNFANDDSVILPVGSFCHIEEQEPSGNPDALTMNKDPQGPQVFQVKSLEDIQPGQENAANIWVFTNTYSRRATAIGAYNYVTGSGKDHAATDSYAFTYRCTLDGKDYPNNTGTYTLDAAHTGDYAGLDGTTLVTRNSAGNDVPSTTAFTAPAGALCTVTESADSVPAAPELAATGRTPHHDRSPYTLFMGRAGKDNKPGLAVDKAAQGGSAHTTPVDAGKVDFAGNMIVPDTTTEQQAFKNRTFTFEVPTTMDAAQPYGYEIVTGHVYVIDTKDITITKTGRLPEDAQDQQFHFKYSCEGGTPHEDIIRVGARFTIAGVPVGSTCHVEEVPDSYTINRLPPQITWTTGANSRIGDFRSYTGTETVQRENNGVSFTVQPVADVNDTKPDPAHWAITVDNSYPNITLTKTIDGPRVSPDWTNELNTAVLRPGQPDMIVNYHVQNTGPLPLTNVSIRDLELRSEIHQLTDDAGNPITRLDDGTLSGLNCAALLQPGQEVDCKVHVKFLENEDRPLYYGGEAYAIAKFGDADVTDQDFFAAIRPPLLPFLLPNTGTKAMVWVLGIGLIVALGALWNYMRRRKDDDGDA